MKRRDRFIIFPVILIVLAFPYLIAALLGKGEHVFLGFLLNPYDGASYLAKMYQGWSGEWLFNLPFTAEKSGGAFLFSFYLFLGHLARWLHLPLLLLFHLTRLVASGFLLFAIAEFLTRVFPARPEMARSAFLLAAFGSGMGWLLLFSGSLPFDFWVAEAYPFLSMYSNPHFPAGMALLVFSFLWLMDASTPARNLKLLGAGLLESIIYPFGLVVLLATAAGWLAWRWKETRVFDWQPFVSAGLLGGPCLLYQFFAIQQDPLLMAWNAQNVTLTPNALDVLLSFSPALLFAIPGWLWLLRQKDNPGRPFLLLWPIFGFAMAYLPFSLQRRFTFGLFLPIAALAIFGVEWIRAKSPGWGRRSLEILFALSAITNLLLVASALLSAGSYPALLYLTQDESKVLTWARETLPPDSVILASPEMSLFIPAATGRRVVYAHPYETVNAAALEGRVVSFYRQPGWSTEKMDLVEESHAGYILLGPRELALGDGPDLSRFPLVHQEGEIKVYSVVDLP